MSRTALIVDDEPHIRRVAGVALRAIGCTVVSAVNGEQAWEEIQHSRPDILVSDVQMPKIDGLQLVRLVRSEPALADLPIILLTAKGFELQQADSEQTATCEVMCKPFSPAALSRRVFEILSDQAADMVATT